MNTKTSYARAQENKATQGEGISLQSLLMTQYCEFRKHLKNWGVYAHADPQAQMIARMTQLRHRLRTNCDII